MGSPGPRSSGTVRPIMMLEEEEEPRRSEQPLAVSSIITPGTVIIGGRRRRRRGRRTAWAGWIMPSTNYISLDMAVFRATE